MPDGDVIIEEDGGERTDGAAPADGGEQTDAAEPEPGRPHLLYPAFDLDTLPDDGGGSDSDSDDDGLGLPANPWRTLPNIATANPDDQPTAL